MWAMFLLSLVSLAAAQYLGRPVTRLYLDSSLGDNRFYIPLSRVAFAANDCGTTMMQSPSEDMLRRLERIYEESDVDIRTQVVQGERCWSLLDLSLGDAHEVIAQVVLGLETRDARSLGQGYFGVGRPYLQGTDSPLLLVTDYITARVHNAEETIDAYNYGYLVFRYDRESRTLLIYNYGYFYSPGL